MAVLRSLRSLVFGETWTVPIGVATTLVTAIVLRGVLPGGTWTHSGGFVVAGLVLATLAVSLRGSR